MYNQRKEQNKLTSISDSTKSTTLQLPHLYHRMRLDLSDLHVIRTLSARSPACYNSRWHDDGAGEDSGSLWNSIKGNDEDGKLATNNTSESDSTLSQQSSPSDEIDSIFDEIQRTKSDSRSSLSTEGKHGGFSNSSQRNRTRCDSQRTISEASNINQHQPSLYSSRASNLSYISVHSKYVMNISETCL